MSKTYLLKLSAKGARIGGDITREEFDKGRSLEQLQKAVGGYLECAPTRFPSEFSDVDCFVDEEGLLKDGTCLNMVVSRLCGGTFIVGNAVFALHDGEGETLGLPEDRFCKLAEYLKSLGAMEEVSA